VQLDRNATNCCGLNPFVCYSWDFPSYQLFVLVNYSDQSRHGLIEGKDFHLPNEADPNLIMEELPGGTKIVYRSGVLLQRGMTLSLNPWETRLVKFYTKTPKCN
jgi:hypothetical protein